MNHARSKSRPKSGGLSLGSGYEVTKLLARRRINSFIVTLAKDCRFKNNFTR